MGFVNNGCPDSTIISDVVNHVKTYKVLTPRMNDPEYPELVDPANPRPSYPAQEKNQKISRPD